MGARIRRGRRRGEWGNMERTRARELVAVDGGRGRGCIDCEVEQVESVQTRPYWIEIEIESNRIETDAHRQAILRKYYRR